MPLPDLQKRLDLLLQVSVHVVVIEDTGSAAVGELVGMSLTQMVPRKRPVIQGGACNAGDSVNKQGKWPSTSKCSVL